VAVDARHLRRTRRCPGPSPAPRHGRIRSGHGVRRDPHPAPRRARPAGRGRVVRGGGRHRLRARARVRPRAGRVRPERRVSRHDGRRAQHSDRADRPAAAPQPAPRRLRRRHRDRPAGRDGRHLDWLLAPGLPVPDRPRPGHCRLLAAPATARRSRFAGDQARSGHRAAVRPAVVPAPLRRGAGRRHERVLPVHRPRGRRRAVGGELLPRAPEPVHGRDGPGHVRLLGRADRRADLPGPRAPPGPAPHRSALRHRPGGDRRGGHLVAARPGRHRDRLRGPRRRPGRGLPRPDHPDPGAHRGAASPARHRLAGGRRRGRRRRSLRPDRPPHRRHQPGRPRPSADHPRGAGRRLRTDPGPPRPSPGSPRSQSRSRSRSRPRSCGPQAVRRVRPGTVSARSRTAAPTARSTGPRH